MLEYAAISDFWIYLLFFAPIRINVIVVFS